jgi:hypothetical protein
MSRVSDGQDGGHLVTGPADIVVGRGVLLSPALCKLNAELIRLAIKASTASNGGGDVAAGTRLLLEAMEGGARLAAGEGMDVISLRLPQVAASCGTNAQPAQPAPLSHRVGIAEVSKASGVSASYIRRLADRGDIPGSEKDAYGWTFPAGTRLERKRRR